MTGKLLRVRPTCRRHSGQSVVTIIPDCLAGSVSPGPISERRQHLQMLLYRAGRTFERQLLDIQYGWTGIGIVGGDQRVEYTAAGQRAIVLTVRPDMSVIDNI